MAADNSPINAAPSVPEHQSSGFEAALRVYSGGRLLFSSSGRWLHPLFELERFILRTGVSTAGLEIADKIIGKAAALLIVRLGFRRAHGGTMSRLATAAFEKHEIEFSYDILVDRIDCATETLLRDVEDVGTAYRIVKQRAGE